MFYPRAEAAARSELLELESKVTKKGDREAVEASLATKVRYNEFRVYGWTPVKPNHRF